jgi:hypothetical protein
VGETTTEILCRTNTTATSSFIHFMDCLHPYISREDQTTDPLYTQSVSLVTDTPAWRNLMYQLLQVNNNCSYLIDLAITGTTLASHVMVTEINEIWIRYPCCTQRSIIS